MISPRSESKEVLLEMVSRTLEIGATEMEVEYEGREEHVLAVREGVGVGIARFDASSQEAHALREALYQISKSQTTITFGGVEYKLKVGIHESFGEDVFRIAIKKA